MNAYRIVLPVLAAACLGGGWLACRWELRIADYKVKERTEAERRTDERRLADEQGEERDLRARLAALKASAAEVERKLAAAEAPASKSAADPAAGHLSAEERHRALVAFANGWLEPEFGPMYAELARNLGLTDAQMDRVRELNAERTVAAWEAVQQFMRAGHRKFPDDQQALQTAVTAAEAQPEGQLRSVLGDSAYSQYQQQWRVAPEDAVAQQVSTLAGPSQALNPTQSAQLAEILAENEPESTAAGPGAILGNFLGNRPAPITDATIQNASAILTPEQLQALKQLQASDQARQTVNRTIQQMRAAMAKAGQK